MGYNKYHLKKGKYQDNNCKAKATIVPGTGVGQWTPYYVSAPKLGEFMENVAEPPEKTELQLAVSKTKKESRRLSPEDQQRNKDAMLARPEDLKFMAPFLEGFCLKYKQWCKSFPRAVSPLFHSSVLIPSQSCSWWRTSAQ